MHAHSDPTKKCNVGFTQSTINHAQVINILLADIESMQSHDSHGRFMDAKLSSHPNIGASSSTWAATSCHDDSTRTTDNFQQMSLGKNLRETMVNFI